ncbi:MAG TPA: hypothetical protein VHR42_04035 [Clostridia bacterium]|nr:hypothetical protein [Clostridia bacterium]
MDFYDSQAWDILQHLFQVKKINDHVLHFTAEFMSELDFSRIKRSVDLLADAFPLIRCGFRESHFHRPVWANRGHTSEQMVSLIETDDSAAAVQCFLCQETDLKNGPQLKVGVIRSGKSDTLCVLINHMLCDAAGFKEVLYTLSSAYTCLENQEKIHIGSKMGDRSIGQILKPYSVKDRIKIYRTKNQLNPHGNQQFDFEGDLSNPFIEIKKIPKDQFRRLKSYAKERGSSINDMILAAYLRVLYRTFGYAAPLPCAIDLRRFLPNRQAGGICNLMSNICCSVGPDIGNSFDDTLSKVKQQMDFQKNDWGSVRNIALLEKLFTVFPYKIAYNLLKKYFSNPPIALTNIGILDKNKLIFGKCVIKNAYMTGSIKYVPNFQVSVTTFDDEATLCVNLYGTEDDRQKVKTFLDDFAAELQNAVLPPC